MPCVKNFSKRRENAKNGPICYFRENAGKRSQKTERHGTCSLKLKDADEEVSTVQWGTKVGMAVVQLQRRRHRPLRLGEPAGLFCWTSGRKKSKTRLSLGLTLVKVAYAEAWANWAGEAMSSGYGKQVPKKKLCCVGGGEIRR